ncbi:MAG: preprotein translocase subunit SecG [Candidatus Eremiobacteraeota bacterium]|nr:preprotein translocase subunit SecG [Candidatus Eremiobacteraeota bacterium]
MLLAQVTPAPAGAVGASSSTLKAAAAAAHKAPNVNATLSPDLLKQLQAFQFAHKSALATNAPWLTHTFAALFLILAVGLVLLLAFQTTKQEGLSGTIGGRVESAYRPRLGFDQQLARLTSYVAIGMVFFAVVLSITGI